MRWPYSADFFSSSSASFVMLRRERMTPEGLFGEFRRTTAVFSLMAAEKASRSIWKSSGFEGTAVSVPPAASA